MLTFDPDKHLYTFGGRPVPSVTQILRELVSRGQDIKASEDLFA